MKYGSCRMSDLLASVTALIEDEGIDALADFSYTQYMIPARRPTKIDTRILAAVHDEIEMSVDDWEFDSDCENYNMYRRTLNL